jgi:peroxiredoxin
MLRLGSYMGVPTGVPEVGRLLVVYFYPGCVCSPEDGYQSPTRDFAQHLAFSRARADLLAAGYAAVGVSSQPTEMQRRAVADARIGHALLSDPELELASALGLPTFNVDGRDWYCRLVLVLARGRIAAVFHPVADASGSASEALVWIREQGEPVASGGS